MERLVAEAPVRGNCCSLYTRPKIRRYMANQALELSTYLQTLDERTSVRPMHNADEVQLDQTGSTLSDGFKFTSAAFRQAAQIIGPGFSKLMPDIAGMLTTDDDRCRLVDGPLAIRIWNELVDLRFALFERYRIIRNDYSRTIEGFVGHKHQYLENLWLYREVSDTLAAQQPDVSMYAAILVGRRFSVWFRNRTPMFTTVVDGQNWPYYSGYYFTNGEATGMSVRGTLAVFTPKGACLGPYRRFGGRVAHTGREFASRLGEMFGSVLQADIPVDKLLQGANDLLTKSLGYDPNGTKEQRKERSKRITHSLGLLGVQKNLAAEVVEQALVVGRYQGVETQAWSQVHQLYASRTLLDLLVPLLHTARKIDIVRREKIEQAAFDVLIGRLIL